MHKKKDIWTLTYQLAAMIVVVIFLAYVIANFSAQLPMLRFALDTAWDLPSAIEKLNTSANGRVLDYGTFLDASGKMLDLAGKEESGGFEMVKDEDGRLLAADFLPYTTNDFSTYGVAMQRLSEIIEKNNGHLLFINPIDRSIGAKSSKSGFPLEDNKYRYDAIDYFMQGYDIPYLNLNEMLAAETENPQGLRYRTDSRWTIPTSFDAFCKIVTAVNDTAYINLDPDGQYTDLSNYKQTVYEQRFLGNLGRRAGAPFAGYDDFTLIVPEFPTSFTVTTHYFDEEAVVTGDFSKALLVSDHLNAEDVYERPMYAAYLGGNAAQRIIENELKPYAPKVLVIGDSYMAPIASFLACAAGEVHYLWQYGNPAVENLEAYLIEEKFDVVLIGISSNMMREGGFGFLADLM